MGTRFELALPGNGRPRRDLRAAGEAALDEIAEWDRRLSAFRRDSLLSFLMREAVDRPVPIDRDTFGLLAMCVDTWRRSGGLFDIAVGGAMRAWGFRDGNGTTPASMVEAVGANHSSADVLLDPERCTVRLARPGIHLDLGGVAKGHAIDRAAAVLRDAGIEHALLHGGTSAVAALGAPDQGDAWSIAIAVPDGAAPPVRVALRDASLAVSAPHGRMVGGHGHIIDPRTASPAACAMVAVVLGRSARDCDAWSKPLIIDPGEHGRPVGMPDELTSFVACTDDSGLCYRGGGPLWDAVTASERPIVRSVLP